MKNVELKKYENMLGKHTGLTLKICKIQLFYSLGWGKPLGVQPTFQYFEFISLIYRCRAQLQITGNYVRIEFPNSEPFDLLFLTVTGGSTHPIVSALWAWASCQIRKIAGAHAPGMPGTFSPSPQVSDPDMHHGTCVTHVPWCMPGSLTSGFLWNRRRGKTFPAFPAHAQTAILRIW